MPFLLGEYLYYGMILYSLVNVTDVSKKPVANILVRIEASVNLQNVGRLSTILYITDQRELLYNHSFIRILLKK
jgi:hypothetical protein